MAKFNIGTLLTSTILTATLLQITPSLSQFENPPCVYEDPSETSKSQLEVVPISKSKGLITTFRQQVRPDEVLTPEEKARRKTTLRHLGGFVHAFTESFHHTLQSIGEPCDYVTHVTWMVKDYTDFFTSTEWHNKVCAFTRFLHCDFTTQKCVCAPEDIHGIKFKAVDPHSLFYNHEQDHNTPCAVPINGPCFIFLLPKKWPGVDFSASVNLKCPLPERVLTEDTTRHVTNTFSCRYYEDKKTKEISERCYCSTTPTVKSLAILTFSRACRHSMIFTITILLLNYF